MKISAIIIQHQHSELTNKCISSLLHSNRIPDEIKVIDNGSDQEHIDALINHPVVEVIEYPDNIVSTPKSYVRAWRHAEYELAMIMNNDTVVADTMVERLVSAMESNSSIGLITPCVNSQVSTVNRNYTLDFPEYVLNSLTAGDSSLFNEWAKELPGINNVIPCNIFEDTVVVFRQQATDEVGYYWEELYGCHNIDYGIRLKLSGWGAATCRNAAFWHINGGNNTVWATPHLSAEYLREGYKSDILMTVRYGEEWRSWIDVDYYKWLIEGNQS